MLTALRFLTALPLPPAPDRPPTSASVWAFPVVGLVVGLCWALPAAVLGEYQVFTVTATVAAIVLVIDALVTGALHLDAVADVADGAASRRPPDAAIAVMREPQIGAVGAAALVLLCLLRFACLIAPADFALPLVTAPVTGRLGMVLLLWAVPVRPGGSLAAAFGQPPSWAVGLATLIAVVLAAAIGRQRGLVALAAGVAVAGVFAVWWRRRFGGLTGDGAGAGGFLAETAALVALSVR